MKILTEIKSRRNANRIRNFILIPHYCNMFELEIKGHFGSCWSHEELAYDSCSYASTLLLSALTGKTNLNNSPKTWLKLELAKKKVWKSIIVFKSRVQITYRHRHGRHGGRYNKRNKVNIFWIKPIWRLWRNWSQPGRYRVSTKSLNIVVSDFSGWDGCKVFKYWYHRNIYDHFYQNKYKNYHDFAMNLTWSSFVYHRSIADWLTF